MAEEKDKKKKLRGLLFLFFKKLKGKCGMFKKAEEWDKFIKENLTPILHNFDNMIPADWMERISNAAKLKDNSKNSIDFACKSVQKDIKGLLKFLPKGGIFANPFVKFILGVAVGGGIIATVLNVTAVTIRIKNNGCETIYPSAYSIIKIPGLQLPQGPIADGGTGVAKLPPITFNVDMTGSTIRFKTFGFNINFQLATSGIDLVFNGNSLVGKNSIITLRDKSEHELLVNCN